MPRKFTVRKISYPSDGVEDVEAPPTGSLWEVASDRSRWVHPDGVIATPPDSSPLLFSTSLQTSEADIMVTFSPPVNIIGHLVVVDDRWIICCVFQTQSTTSDGI